MKILFLRAYLFGQKIELCPFFIRRPKTLFFWSLASAFAMFASLSNSQKYESHFEKT